MQHDTRSHPIHDPLASGSMGEVVHLVESAVLEAAQYLREASHTRAALEVKVKADKTLVMNLDIESQRRALSKLGNSLPIVAEEDESSHSLIEGGGSYFLVDPLDGTTSCKRFFGQTGGHVGFGPLVGFVKDDLLSVASFYSVPHDTLLTAVRGQGTYISKPSFVDGVGHGERRKLEVSPCDSLSQAGVLFFIGHNGESRVVQHLRSENAVENLYRFGGFANDCGRLAQGFEQMSVQFSCKPWDFSAALLAAESGLEVWLDPLGRRVPLSSWRIEPNNPLIIVHPGIRQELFAVLDRMK